MVKKAKCEHSYGLFAIRRSDTTNDARFRGYRVARGLLFGSGMDHAPLPEYKKYFKASVRTMLVKSTEYNAERDHRAKLLRFNSHLLNRGKKEKLSHPLRITEFFGCGDGI